MSDAWVETTLGEIATWGSGGTPKAGRPEFYEGGTIPWAVIADLQDGPVGHTSKMLTPAGVNQIGHMAPEGAVLVSMYGTIGRLAMTTRAMATNQAIAWGIADRGRIDPWFLFHWLRGYQPSLDALARGATQRNINREILKSQRILLPPLAVQRRIVDLMTHLDNHLANLVVDVHSVEGLTRALRDGLFGSFDGPNAPASQMFDMLLGRQKSERQSVGDYVLPYLRAANIGEEGLRLNDVQTMNFEPNEQQKYGLVPDDILIVEGGSVGLAARWEGAILGTVGFDKHVIRLRARPELSSSEYGLQWAKWCREAGVFEAQATGITIKALGFGRASALPVPDIPLSEQERLTAPLAGAEHCLQLLRSEVKSLRSLRTSMLSLLLSGDIVIPDSYDSLLAGVA